MSSQNLGKTSRRDLVRWAAAGLGVSASGWFPTLVAHANQSTPRPTPKRCILLWMGGGPCQSHTFSLTENERFRPVRAIPTAVPGIQISEFLPRLAESMNDLAILRSMSTGINAHSEGQYLMHVGFRPSASVYPSLGAIVSRELTRPDLGMPNYVVLDAGSIARNFQQGGPLGPNFSPLMASSLRGVDNLQSSAPNREEFRAGLLDRFSRADEARFQSDAILAHRASYRNALDLMHSSRMQVFNVDSEPMRIREMYGASGFGRACLVARRLVEVGVSFVEVNWGGYTNAGPWDTHTFGRGLPTEKLRNNLTPPLDRGFAALIQDLKERGLLESTLVVWMGEFGRTPIDLRTGTHDGPNGVGTGHYARCWATVLAGAGVKGGQFIGRATPDGVEPAERPVNTADFLATICRALDIDHTKTYESNGRRMPYTMFGSQPIAELF